MQSVKSYFNKTLYLHDLKRGWPIWGSYFLIWFLMLPMQGFLTLRDSAARQERFADIDVLSQIRAAPWLCAVFAILAAMSLFHYLYQPRSANALHALPLRREGHFLTHVAAGLTYFIAPNVLLALLTLAAEGMCGHVNAGQVLLWLLYNSLVMVLFFGLAVFCAQFTGHIVALPAFYFIWNALFAFLYLMLDAIFRMLLFGYESILGLSTAATYLTPMLAMQQFVCSVSVPRDGAARAQAQLDYPALAFVYAGIGLLLLGAALVLYRRRRVESAGDVVAVQGAKPLFRYGMALCVGVGGGLGLASIFNVDGKLFFSCAAVFCAMAGCFIAEMLLQKSFRVLRLGWKRAVCVAAAMLALIVGIGMDFTGFGRRVPDAAKVESVQVSGPSTYPSGDSAGYPRHTFTSDAEIAAVIAAHSRIVSDRWEYDGRTYSSYLNLRYRLDDGSTLLRSYAIPLEPENLADAGSAASIALDLFNDPAVLAQLFGVDSFTRGDVTGATLRHEQYRSDGNLHTYELNQAQALMLYDAFTEDLADRRIGQRRFSKYGYTEDAWRVSLYYYYTEPQYDGDTSATRETAQITFAVEPGSTATRAVLEELLDISLFE